MRALLALSFTASLWAQIQVQIVADKSRLVAGESLTLTAVARDASGTVRRGETIVWSTNPATTPVGTVTTNGVLTTQTLGIVVVRATAANGSFVETPFQVLPSKLQISPTSAELKIGESRQFTATALDKDGKALAGVSFSWSLVGSGFDGPPPNDYVQLSSSGVAKAAFEGGAYVRATFAYQSPSGGVPLNMAQRLQIEAPVRVNGPRDFSVTALMRTAQSKGMALRYRPSLLWPTVNGLYFNASLDGIGNGLLRWKDGRIEPILLAGTPSLGVGSYVIDEGMHSILPTGEIFAYEQASDGNRVQKTTADGGFEPVLVNSIPGAGVDFIGGFNLSRNSLNSYGQFLFRASYRDPETRQFVNGMFRGAGLQVNDLLLGGLERLPELPAGNFNIDSTRFGLADDSTAYYTVSSGTRTVMYRDSPATGRAKFLATGDEIGGSTITGFLGSPDSSATQAFFVAPNGDVLVGLGLANGKGLLVRTSGDTTDTLPLNWGTLGVVDHQPAYGSLVLGPLNNAIRLAIWKTDAPRILMTIGDELGGGKVETIFGGGFGPNGEVYIQARISDASVVTARLEPDPQILFRTGDRVTFSAPPVIAGFAGAARSGPVQLLAGGGWGNQSIVEYASGALRPAISVGDIMGRDSIFSGASPASYVRTAGGRIYTLVPWVGGSRTFGIARLRDDGSPEMLHTFNLKIDGIDYYQPYRLLANDNGDLLWQTGTSKGDARIMFTRNGQHQVILSDGETAPFNSIDGLRIFGIDNLVMDEDGRVLAQVRFRERPNSTVIAWDGASWRQLLTIGITNVNGRRATGASNLRAAGNHLMLQVSFDGGLSAVVEWTASGLTTVVSPSEVTPLGYNVNSVATFDVNRAGDIAYVSGFSDGQGIFVKRGGKTYVAMNTTRPIGAELVRAVTAIELRNDGTLYILAPNEKSEVLLYQASPL